MACALGRGKAEHLHLPNSRVKSYQMSLVVPLACDLAPCYSFTHAVLLSSVSVHKQDPLSPRAGRAVRALLFEAGAHRETPQQCVMQLLQDQKALKPFSEAGCVPDLLSVAWQDLTF